MAFRNVPLNSRSWKFLVLKAYHPVKGELFYFVDKCLPFGSSISCKIFQDFSDAGAFIVTRRTGKDNINCLDDFFFADLLKRICDYQVKEFLQVCAEIKIPVALGVFSQRL